MTNLWAVNSLGKVYTLSTNEDHWVEIKSDGVDFKKIASHEFFTWAISSDHQIYIYVPTRDIPIRYRVVTYENERWIPFSGFSDKLLPTDRPHWSSADGLVSLPQENFQLPSTSWEWEEEWYVEDNLDGQPLEPEGWTYAVDFPASYSPNSNWNSVVRRRKWIRYRRFCATNKWSLIPSIHEDPVQEPFIDVAVGGTEIPGGESSKFTVWAVTIMGRVLFRYGVTEISPEGSGWVPVKTPGEADVSQISVGPTGLTWAVTWAGNALVRTGVMRENIMGNDWVIVDPPSSSDPLTQISVGKNVVWALSKDNKVWFRKGIDGLHSGENVKDAAGISWIEMFGTLTGISVGIDDQVFSISSDAFDILLRTGVNSNELFGRTWKTLKVPLHDLNNSPSSSSLDSMSTISHRDSVFTSDSVSLSQSPQNSRKISTLSVVSSTLSLKSEFDNCANLSLTPDKSSELGSQDSGINHIQDTTHNQLRSMSIRTSSYSSLDSESLYAEKTLMFQSTMEMTMNQSSRDLMWVWISASGCAVNSESLPYWFLEAFSISKSAVDELWYSDIVSQLKDRFKREVAQFSTFPRAIEQSTWVKTAVCRFFKNSWVNGVLELVQHGESSSKGLLTCHYQKDQASIQLSDITCATCLPDWNKNILVIHTAKKTKKGSPYKISFTSNDDLEDWVATINTTCRNVSKLPWVPEKISAWSLTVNGDVYVHKASHKTETNDLVKMKWSLLGGGHLRLVETCPAGITWGVGYNCIAWTYSKGYGGGPYHGVPGSNALIGPMSDTRCLYIYENQRWNPLSGFTSKGLPTDRYMWSDQTGRIECTKDNTHLPSGHWQWISDWCIDYKTPGGVDNEGWQYATDFPRSYHGYRRFTDYVRRRRWYRKCKLITTGPWKQLGSTPLLDVSFQVDPSSDNESISVWAVAINGDVIYRSGVTENSPRGLNWIHIPSEKSFRSISVGGGDTVWGVAEDGSAQLRHGICSAIPSGQYWCHIEPPQVGCSLRQISAGKTRVFAVDENNRLWSRQEIVPIFKEGTHWKLVSDDVKQVSVGPLDQVWCIKNNFAAPSGVISGVVCRRTGITEENPCGTGWVQGIGGCWTHITVRGCLFPEEK
ncbi:tectonin beta-propeller repeat-containing protein 1 [Nephila pilipes]|uniref:Tectonin beta-propeller repeat-containing protein 1 n=1 Tax=Nephila pilipes TaxID=299642 RepID=A0A8X6QP64_NEPPI|nr:tectonin beta-propeller repeat-containing protein 1 [Nephila pilipes]